MKVQRTSFQSNRPFVVVICKNSHDRSPMSEMMFAVMCFLLFSHLFVLFLLLSSGIKMTNKAGIPILGKKFGAIPNKYLTIKLSPL